MKIYFNSAKVFVNINGGFYWDNLVGWYTYKKGNMVVFSNYNRIGNTTLESTIQGGNENQAPNTILAYFKDVIKEKSAQVTLKLNAAQNQITWKQEVTPGLKIRLPGSPPKQEGFTLPDNMVLIKL